ncbi:MAG TPA: DUF11 domain-containing protein, partial [Pirellulales bacterium]
MLFRSLSRLTRSGRRPRRERPPQEAPQVSRQQLFRWPYTDKKRSSEKKRPSWRWAGRFRRCRLEQCEERAMLSFHLWKIDQVFSSADGKAQFIELHDPANGESHTGGHFISSNENKFVFPADLPSDNTANMHFLIGTRSYAALPGAVQPDYVVPDNFFNPNGDTFDYADVDTFTFTAGQLPTDGVAALFRDVSSGNLSTGKNLETDLAGQSASVTLAAPAAANLTVANSAPASERAGTPFTYTINVNNSGNATASGAVISDTLPAGLLNVSAVDSAGAVQVSGSQITDALSSLPGGATETLTITATPA